MTSMNRISLLLILFLHWILIQNPMATRMLPSKNKCDPSRLDQCLQYITQVTTDSKLSFPETFQELQSTCNILEHGDQCTQEYIEDCWSNRTIGMVWNIVQGTKIVLRLLCHNATIQNDYLRHAACFKRMALDHCGHALEKFRSLSTVIQQQQQQQEQRQPQDVDHTADSLLKEFCCQYKTLLECQTRSIREECPGQETSAGEFFQKYTHKISDSLLMEHCLTYTHSNQCFNMNARIETSKFLVVSSLFCLIIYLYLFAPIIIII